VTISPKNYFTEKKSIALTIQWRSKGWGHAPRGAPAYFFSHLETRFKQKFRSELLKCAV